jgi:hypothetical protein
MSSSETCPKTPSTEQKFEPIQNALNAAGANQKCKSIFNNAVDSGMQKVDAAAAVVAFPFGGGAASTSYTNAQNKMRESLSKEGCSDLFMNINQQINSTQSILCEVSNAKSTTNLSGSANASIKIIQSTPDSKMLALRGKVLASLSVPKQPSEALASIDKDLYKLAYSNYMEAIEIHKQEIDSIMGNVTIENVDFKNKASVDMKLVSDISNISTTAIAAQFKEVAHASAMNELKNKTGLGANSDTVKSIVTNKIANKNQSITDSIKNQISNIKMGAASDASVLITFYGALTLKNVVFDQFAQSRLITQNIISSASNMGKSVALDLLSDAHSATHSDKESTGQDKVLKDLLAGQAKLSAENAKGAADMFGKATGFLGSIMSMMALVPLVIGVVVLLFFPEISNVIAPGPLKYVLAGVLMYFILAWFIGFWPFGKSEKSIFPEDLAYVRTAKGYKRDKGPYEFHVGQVWTLQ